MPLGNVNLTLRPPVFGFLMDPAEHAGIRQAMELSSFLWGGTFNPIVPVFRHAPKAWRDRFDHPTAKEIAEGLTLCI